MKMNLIIGACLLLASTCIYAEATFVGIGELDQVFLNYDKEGDAGWKAPASKALKVKVAAGSVLASNVGAVASEGPDKAFDGSAQTKYCTHASAIWLQRHFEDGKRRIVAYGLISANDFPKRDPRTWTLLGSNDGKQWNVLDQRSDEMFSKRFQRRQFKVKGPGDYAWYKLDVTHNQGAGTTQLAELQLLTAKDAETLAQPQPAAPQQIDAAGWTSLFEGDLSDAEFPAGVWTIENGELTARTLCWTWNSRTGLRPTVGCSYTFRTRRAGSKTRWRFRSPTTALINGPRRIPPGSAVPSLGVWHPASAW